MLITLMIQECNCLYPSLAFYRIKTWDFSASEERNTFSVKEELRLQYYSSYSWNTSAWTDESILRSSFLDWPLHFTGQYFPTEEWQSINSFRQGEIYPPE